MAFRVFSSDPDFFLSEITPDSDYAQAVRAGGYKIWTEVDRLSGAFAIVKYVGRMRGWSVMQLDKAMV